MAIVDLRTKRKFNTEAEVIHFEGTAQATCDFICKHGGLTPEDKESTLHFLGFRVIDISDEVIGKEKAIFWGKKYLRSL